MIARLPAAIQRITGGKSASQIADEAADCAW